MFRDSWERSFVEEGSLTGDGGATTTVSAIVELYGRNRALHCSHEKFLAMRE